MPKGQDFDKRYVARLNTPVDAYAPFSSDAVNVLYAAMKRVNSTDRAKSLSAMPMTHYEGVIGPVAFDAHGDLKDAANTIYTFKDKKSGTTREGGMSCPTGAAGRVVRTFSSSCFGFA
jgi:branched-chain amino acid transport system substrate-binding protein